MNENTVNIFIVLQYVNVILLKTTTISVSFQLLAVVYSNRFKYCLKLSEAINFWGRLRSFSFDHNFQNKS